MLSTDVPTFVQIIMAFTLGILFAPFSYGLLYFLIFLISYEAIAIYLSRMNCRYWCFRTRVSVVIASIVGFLIGRWVDGRKDLLEDDKKKSKRV